jgi:NAD(P)H dehydrogenase (quinone)
MTIAVLGATGKVGSRVVDELLASGRRVRVLVRDAGKAAKRFGPAPSLEVMVGDLGDRRFLTDGLNHMESTFVAMGSIGTEGNLQRLIIHAAATVSNLHLLRLSVLNAGPDSLGINQRAHANIDYAAVEAGIPYTTIQPAIFSASLLVAAGEVRTERRWTGLADRGSIGLIDHRDVADVAVHILMNSSLWGGTYELTGPCLITWPMAMKQLSAELGIPITFETTSPLRLIQNLIRSGVSAGQAELLVAREWAIENGENSRLTNGVEALAGHPPRTVEAFLHENRKLFLP